MTKQEEIREGIFKICFPSANYKQGGHGELIDKLLDYLHSQGVVIKKWEQFSSDPTSQHITFEPLIKEPA